MFILSEGVQRTGIVQILGRKSATYTRDDEGKQLMVPVAFKAAQRLGANAFSFILAVTFAASTAFMTPVGYQTNLFVYGPGGYRFSDYLRVGGPLQLLFAIVTTAGIAVLWGV